MTFSLSKGAVAVLETTVKKGKANIEIFSRAAPSGGLEGGEATPQEIRQSDYNALISVISAPQKQEKYINQCWAALLPCSKKPRYGTAEHNRSFESCVKPLGNKSRAHRLDLKVPCHTFDTDSYTCNYVFVQAVF